MRIWKRARQVVENSKDKPSPSSSQQKPAPISLDSIKKDLTDIDDVVFKEFQTKDGLVTVIYLSSLIEPVLLHKMIIFPLVNDKGSVMNTFDAIDGRDKQKLLMAIVNGDTVIFHHNTQQYLQAHTFSPPERAITSSENEATVLGPQDSFTDSLTSNLSLIKRRIHQ